MPHDSTRDPKHRKRWLKIAGTIVVLITAGWMLRGCYSVFVNKEDQPAADRIVAALDGYKAAKGRYPPTLDALVPQHLPALPTPRAFGRIGYTPMEDGRGCLVAYFTHRDFLQEFDCAAKAWNPVEYDESRLMKEKQVQWLTGPSS